MLATLVVDKTPEINSGISVPYLTLLMQLVKGHGDGPFAGWHMEQLYEAGLGKIEFCHLKF